MESDSRYLPPPEPDEAWERDMLEHDDIVLPPELEKEMMRGDDLAMNPSGDLNGGVGIPKDDVWTDLALDAFHIDIQREKAMEQLRTARLLALELEDRQTVTNQARNIGTTTGTTTTTTTNPTQGGIAATTTTTTTPTATTTNTTLIPPPAPPMPRQGMW
jgi:hypothetical protein